MSERVLITGVGAISALGVGIDPLWQAMLEGRSGLRRIERFDPSGFASQVAGELPGDDFKVRKIVPKSHRKAVKVMCRDIELAVGAAAAAVEDAGIVTAATDSDAEPTIDPDRMGCQIGAGLISAELNELGAALVTSQREDGSFDLQHWGREGMENLTPLWLLKYLPNMLACHVTIVHDCRGPSNTITCCEASSGLSFAESRRVILRGSADACLSGGVEDRVNPLALFRQHCAGRLAPGSEVDTAVQPFSPHANGTIVGEGGGLLLLESESSLERRGGTAWCSLDGVGSSQSLGDSPLDAEPEAIAAAINAALSDANCTPVEIDAIVPLGSGIATIDDAERAALAIVFGDRLPEVPCITTIPYTGNCLSGNGGLAVAVAASALRHQQLPARLGSDETPGIDASACPSRAATLRRVLVTTPSEGGQCVAIVLGAVAV